MKNYIYQFIYQLINLIFPLATLPYVSKILGTENMGLYTYSFSVISYMILVSDLGIKRFGSREIAYFRENDKEINRIFLELNIQKLIFSLLVFLIFYIFFIFNKYENIYLIQALYILLSFLDLSWVYEGFENFKKIATRNLYIKILLMLLIFSFVKTKDDLLLYTIIMLVSNTVGNIIFWYKLPFKLEISTIKKIKPFRNIKGTFLLFLPQIAISIYTSLDRIMLGKMTEKKYVAFYDISNKFVILSMIIITTAGTVYLPQIANLYQKKEITKIKDTIKKVLNIYIIISLPLIFGIISVSEKLIKLLFDYRFYDTIFLIKLMSIIIIFWTFNNITGSFVLIPMKMEKKLTLTVFIGCVMNIILNFILIPKYKAIGAVIATMFTEGTVTLLQIYYSRHFFKFNISTFLKALLSSIVMYLILLKVGNLYLKIILGIISYIFFLVLLREKVFFSVLNDIKKFIKKLREKL